MNFHFLLFFFKFKQINKCKCCLIKSPLCETSPPRKTEDTMGLRVMEIRNVPYKVLSFPELMA